MGKLLEAFAEGCLCAERESRSEAQRQLCERSYRLHDRLEEKLDDEERNLLESLMDSIFDENCCDSQNSFIRGYRLGVLMTMEVFAGQDELLLD